MNKKVKICFVSTASYALFNPSKKIIHGGAEIQLFFLGKELSKYNELTISYAVGDYGQSEVEEYDSIKVYKTCNPSSHDTLFTKGNQATKYWKAFRKINADIYFTSTPNAIVGLVNLFCKIYRKKHFHRTAHKIEVDGTYAENGLIGKLFLLGLKNAKVIFTQNKTHQYLLQQNYKLEAIVLKNGFYISKNIKYDKQFVLWVARCQRWKRPELFIFLAKNCPDINFVMICPIASDSIYHNSIKEEAGKLKNLNFINQVPFKEIQIYFNKAKVFVNTSEAEGFPNTFIQAGLGKTPILSLNVNPDNFITNYTCGYYCNNSLEEMKKQLGVLLNNPQDWKEKSNQVFEYIEEYHNIERNARVLKKKIINFS